MNILIQMIKKLLIKRTFWRRFLFLVIFLVLLMIIFWKVSAFIKVTEFFTQKFEVIFLDVGQGDSILIKTPNQQVVLIDGGPDNSVLWGLGNNLPFYRRRIDVVIISHYHDDHVAGLIEVLKRYRVKKIIYPADSPTSEISQTFLDSAERRKIPIIYLSASAQLDFGAGCSMFLLNPDIFGIKPDDNDSLVAKLDCRQTKFLLAGDNNSKIEQALINSGEDYRADVLKASHHGSITANSELFLRAVNPRLLIISVGIDNRFGHPSPIILERAADLDIPVRRTDQEGEIKLIGASGF